MSEQKGSYAHVGLPGLRELFAGGGKAMKYELSNEEAIQAIKSNYPPENCTMLREALDMAMNALQVLAEKDATIQREYTLKHEAYNNLTRCHETMADNAEEITRLRKALKFAGWDIKQKMGTKTIKTPSWVLLESLGHVNYELVDVDLEGDVVNLTVVEGDKQ